MEPVTVYVNIILGDIIGSAVIQGGENNAVDYALPKLTPAVAKALSEALRQGSTQK